MVFACFLSMGIASFKVHAEKDTLKTFVKKKTVKLKAALKDTLENAPTLEIMEDVNSEATALLNIKLLKMTPSSTL